MLLSVAKIRLAAGAPATGKDGTVHFEYKGCRKDGAQHGKIVLEKCPSKQI
jgi:hypothetical protein